MIFGVLCMLFVVSCCAFKTEAINTYEMNYNYTANIRYAGDYCVQYFSLILLPRFDRLHVHCNTDSSPVSPKIQT